MPSSFDALHEETRPLRMMEPTESPASAGAALASLLLIVLPVLAVVLL